MPQVGDAYFSHYLASLAYEATYHMSFIVLTRLAQGKLRSDRTGPPYGCKIRKCRGTQTKALSDTSPHFSCVWGHSGVANISSLFLVSCSASGKDTLKRGATSMVLPSRPTHDLFCLIKRITNTLTYSALRYVWMGRVERVVQGRHC